MPSHSNSTISLHKAALACLDAMAPLSNKSVRPDAALDEVFSELRAAVAMVPPTEDDPFIGTTPVRVNDESATSYHAFVIDKAKDWLTRLPKSMASDLELGKTSGFPVLMFDPKNMRTELAVEMQRWRQAQSTADYAPNNQSGAEQAEGASKREVTLSFAAADQAARELHESLIELKGVVHSIRNLPQQDLLTHGANQLRAWRYRFEAGLKCWLPAVEELTPTAADSRARRGLPPVGRWSSAVEWLKDLARLGKETLEELDRCHPLSSRDTCPSSGRSLTPSGWVELAAHRLGGRITDEMEGLEPELRRDLELVKADVANARKGAEPQDEQSDRRKKAKRSTERGEGRAKLIAALTKHHKYADGGCLNLVPVGNNELARMAKVDQATASAFFKKEFKGHDKYRATCADAARLAAALKLLNGEYAPHHLYGAKPPEEDERNEE
jgi:hypothetical protein